MAASALVIPHSFVLADLFDVSSMSLEVPDHLLEQEPGLEWIPCPTCDGEGWVLAAEPNGWTSGDAFTPCPRCHRSGEVLDFSHTRLGVSAPIQASASHLAKAA